MKVTVWYMFQVKLNFLLKCLSWQNWHSISNVLWYSNRCFLIILGEIKNFVANLVFSCSEQEELNHQFLRSFLHLFSSLILLWSRREKGISLRVVDLCKGECALSDFHKLSHCQWKFYSKLTEHFSSSLLQRKICTMNIA